MNHGRKKQDQVKQDDLKQQEYETFDSEMRLNRINKIHSLKSLASTSNLLSINPDYYTCWNYRREILVELFKSSNPQELCLTELKFTESCLLIHPKSYWVWFHRKWALQQMPDPIYKIEFKLLDGLLNLDNRNFHIWVSY